MTANEAIAYIENYTWSTTRLGLDRTRELLRLLGDPQKKLRFVHVAGSNGKGSTCAMLDSVLREAGYRTGLYTSPYIEEFCERMRVNGDNINGNQLARLTEIVREKAESMEDHPSQFELVTAIAMLYFLEENCDIVVLEVGMGGELDSTNVIDAPECAVITNIGLEHTEYLGDTLEKIAHTKAGIIKQCCSCVCYDGEKAVTDTVAEVCREKSVPLFQADFSELQSQNETLAGQKFCYRGEAYEIGLLGLHQLKNASVVLETVEVLRARGFQISEKALREGLRCTKWPARLEVLGTDPLFILDGGHNPQCAEALANSLHKIIHNQKAVFVIGVLADKDYAEMIRLILPFAEQFICLTPFSPRALPAEKLAEYLQTLGARAEAFEEVPAALKAAFSAAGEDGRIVSFGSLYLAGTVRSGFIAAKKAWLRTMKLAERRALSDEERAEKSRRICEKIISIPEFQNAKIVLVTSPMKDEVDITLVTRIAGKMFLYPRCDGKTLVAAGGELKKGAYGIMEPTGESVAPEAIDLVICPCAAFDDKGSRLGMGGGYYDRFLPLCRNAAVIAAAFACQRAKNVSIEKTDVPMQKVITENS